MRFHIDADGISYLSIAKHYLDGDFARAVNGYWGPLLSWLIAPFMALGANPLVAAKLAGFASGLLALWGVRRLCAAWRLSKSAETAVLFTSVPLALSFFAEVISPDLLVAGLLAHYLAGVFSERFSESEHDGPVCGALGALAYLAKGYALPFFVAHYAFVCAYKSLAAQPEARRRLFKTWLSGMAVFALLCAPWVTLLSVKYGKFTVTTTGRYNRAVVGPSYRGHPVNYEGFYPPANSGAVSVWEDPSVIPVRPWGMFDSGAAFSHQIGIAARNLLAELSAFQSVSCFAPAILLALLFLAFEAGGQGALAALAVATIAVYCAGYIPIVARARYLYIAYLLLLAAGGKLLETGVLKFALSRAKTAVLSAVFFGSFLMAPAVNLAQSVNSGKEIYALSSKLGCLLPPGVKIASNTRWMETLYLAYFANARYYGQAATDSNPRALAAQLDALGVQLFFAWRERPLSPEGWREITGGVYPGLLVFSPPGVLERRDTARTPSRPAKTARRAKG
ncbi:MAG: hypothetical protein PHP45_02660 [Elusimicrobiales bacterium]|nr:hypothetical protein [Elusimicrobiales bacterium]